MALLPNLLLAAEARANLHNTEPSPIDDSFDVEKKLRMAIRMAALRIRRRAERIAKKKKGELAVRDFS